MVEVCVPDLRVTFAVGLEKSQRKKFLAAILTALEKDDESNPFSSDLEMVKFRGYSLGLKIRHFAEIWGIELHGSRIYVN